MFERWLSELLTLLISNCPLPSKHVDGCEKSTVSYMLKAFMAIFLH